MMLACQWWHTPPEKFVKLQPGEQALRIAVYRTNRMIDSVLAFENAKKLKQQRSQQQ